MRRPVIGVMGSGREPLAREQAERAEALGRFLAGHGIHLLTGGGRGAMAAVSAAFAATPGRRGLVIGVLPARPDDPLCRPRDGYPNPFVEIAIATHLPLSGAQGTEPLSRNHINVLSADVVIALEGGAGTRSEVELALRYRRPVGAFLAHRADLPGLPAEVPLLSSLAEAGAFLAAHLGARWQRS